jgi:hypothetical protein
MGMAVNEERASRNRRIVGTLLAIRNAGSNGYDFERFFEGHLVDEFVADKRVAAFSILLAAQLIGESARQTRGIADNAFIGLDLPPAIEENRDITAAFRLTVVVMNRDVDTASAIVDTVVQSQTRSRNVLACLLGMLMEAQARVS